MVVENNTKPKNLGILVFQNIPWLFLIGDICFSGSYKLSVILGRVPQPYFRLGEILLFEIVGCLLWINTAIVLRIPKLSSRIKAERYLKLIIFTELLSRIYLCALYLIRILPERPAPIRWYLIGALALMAFLKYSKPAKEYFNE